MWLRGRQGESYSKPPLYFWHVLGIFRDSAVMSKSLIGNIKAANSFHGSFLNCEQGSTVNHVRENPNCFCSNSCHIQWLVPVALTFDLPPIRHVVMFLVEECGLVSLVRYLLWDVSQQHVQRFIWFILWESIINRESDFPVNWLHPFFCSQVFRRFGTLADMKKGFWPQLFLLLFFFSRKS